MKDNSKKNKIVVAVSGGFDPVHIGHLRMFDEAKALGDELVVILNNDNWLKKKKGYFFMGEKERKEIIEGFRSVDRVYITKHGKNPKDMSVCDALRVIRPNIFANGGDRKHDNIPEVDVCNQIGTEMVFGVGRGGKVQSSSSLLSKYGLNKIGEKDFGPRVGIGIMILKGNKVLLGKRKGSHAEGEWAFPGGHLEYMESFKKCALREIKEECGIKVKNLRFQLLARVKVYKPKDYTHINLLAEWKSGEPRVLEPNKCKEWRWFPLDKLPHPLMFPTSISIDSFKTGKNFFDF